jgi:hypothetical protein
MGRSALPVRSMGQNTIRLQDPKVEKLEGDALEEAPTGSGKTEAALIRADRLVAAGVVDGMYFAVPTRSAATELHDRISKVMGNVHATLPGRVVCAVPGMLDVDRPPGIWDEPATPTWALGSTRRVMSAPIAVGTIDQTMLTQLRTRHSWLSSLNKKSPSGAGTKVPSTADATAVTGRTGRRQPRPRWPHQRRPRPMAPGPRTPCRWPAQTGALVWGWGAHQCGCPSTARVSDSLRRRISVNQHQRF